jgi:hypothetical protein
MRFSLLTLLICLVSACGRSDLFEPAKSAAMPQPLAAECKSSCTSVPAGVKTPVSIQNGFPLHWALCGRCLEVAVDRDLPSDTRARVPGVLAAWSEAAGGGLCLRMADREAMHPVEGDVDWIQVGAIPLGEAALSTSTVTFETTGRIRHALIEIASADPAERALSYGVGQALGLGSSNDPLNSVMTSGREGRTTPGPDDAATLRAMYGPPEWCTR